MRKSPREREWECLLAEERNFVSKGSRQNETYLGRLLADKVPQQLQSTLDAAFSKAFNLIFEKGTGIIEKTYKKEDLEHQFKINAYSAELRENKKTLGAFRRQSNTVSAKNLLLSGVEGIGLGALGIGLPDIPIFVGVLLKSVYEIALNWGYTYDTPEEKYFILKVIETSLSHGRCLIEGDRKINEFIEEPSLPMEYSQSVQIDQTSATMSGELLYLKFLQVIPIVGAVGGAYNTVYLQKVLRYAKLKYHRRFLVDTSGARRPDDAC